MQNGIPNLGDTILGGKFHLDELIGSGGMGQVFKATHLDFGREIAIKFLRDKHTDNPQTIKRFQQEARLAGSIGHDNICEVTDLGTDERGFHYLAMPLLSGVSMDRLLKQSKGLPLDRVLDWMCQTLSALDAAHQNHIIHRDLKPSNIFVTRVGDRENFIKLLDFGISKVLDEDEPSDITESGIALGTPHYMAPELARGTKDIDYRVDIYGAGVILYEALTGKKPFKGDSYNDVMFNIVAGDFTAPRTLNPLIPTPVEAVIVKAMARDREDRFSNAEQMRQALNSCPNDFLETPLSDETSDSTAVERPVAPFSKPSLRPASGEDSPKPVRTSAGLKWIGLGLLGLFLLGAVLLWPEKEEVSVPIKSVEPQDAKTDEPETDETKTPALKKSEPTVKDTEAKQAPIDENTVGFPATGKEKPKKNSKKTSKGKKINPPDEVVDNDRDPTTVDGRMDTLIFTEF